MTDHSALIERLDGIATDNRDTLHPITLAAITEAAAALRDLTEWRDIATAPKDGTVIDIWVTGAGSRRIPSCRWRKPARANWGDLYGCDKDLPEQWVTSGGFSLDRRNGDATHWLPPPSAPNQAKEGE